MSECEFTSLLQAYHDGQLSAGRRREAEEHVSSCAACAAELERLRDLSRTLATARPEPIRPDELGRLHDVITTYTVEERDDRRILRLGVGLSAVAASILIISTAWLYDGPAGNASPAGPRTSTHQQMVTTGESWENVAVGRPEVSAGARPTGTAMDSTTDWMIGGMKGAGEHGNP
jgi:anti-sigma factor RsiW